VALRNGGSDMATLATRDLKIGNIIDKTLGVLERSAVPVLIFVVVLSALTAPISYFAVGSTAFLRVIGGELLKIVAGIVCSYFLLVPMLRRAGFPPRPDDDAMLPFVGLSIISSLGIMLGMLAIILPGLFVMARWSIAQPLLVVRGTGMMASLSESWERTKGNEFQIIVAVLALALLPVALIIGASVVFEQADPVRIIAVQLVGSAMSAVFLAMGVALYGLIVTEASTPSAH
jgi:hypothetical protein